MPQLNRPTPNGGWDAVGKDLSTGCEVLGITAITLGVYVVMQGLRPKGGWTIAVGEPRLAALSNLSRREVRREVINLVAIGAVAIQGGRRTGVRSTYVLHRNLPKDALNLSAQADRLRAANLFTQADRWQGPEKPNLSAQADRFEAKPVRPGGQRIKKKNATTAGVLLSEAAS